MSTKTTKESRSLCNVLVGYFKSKLGRDLSFNRRMQLVAIALALPLGDLQTREQLHVLRVALDEMDQLRPAKPPAWLARLQRSAPAAR